MTTTHNAHAQDHSLADFTGVELHLSITDSELCAELETYEEGAPRDDFSIDALRIGILALRRAQGRIDTDRIRAEGERLIAGFESLLAERQRAMSQDLSASLKNYFDPEGGRFTERVERLIRHDGELEQTLRRHIGGTDSELVRALAGQVGQHSPLMKVLDPDSSDGLLHTLTGAVADTLTAQRERILSEFSLDNKSGALARLVAELSDKHGEVSAALEKRIGDVVDEFSLDREESALSRLVRRVERAQTQISNEFSLDEEGSALARMRRDLLDVIKDHREANDRFQQQVLERLAEMVARKQEADRSTRHGEDFELAVFRMLQDRSARSGDVATHTGNTTGAIRNCKKGDVVLELGKDCAAAGARIVAEAKQDASYTLDKALDEIDRARKNRCADVGLFIFSARSAPDGLEKLARYGDDVVAIWDAEDPASDVILFAAISVARALCTRARAVRDADVADFAAIEGAILEIEKQATGLDAITKSAQTIQNGSNKILDRARIMRAALDQQVALLGDRVEQLKEATID